MTTIHVVMRPVPAAGGLIPSGAVVDTRTWRNVGKLITQRYLRPATPEEAATISTDKQPKKAKEK